MKRSALFSIRPPFAEAILSGTKLVEFRRTRMASDVERVVIYAPAPLRSIVGWFDVTGVRRMTPRQAWIEFGDIGGIDQSAFDRYYEGATQAVVIGAGVPVRLSRPIRLGEIDARLRPPQSFVYLRPPALERLYALTGSHDPQAIPLEGVDALLTDDELALGLVAGSLDSCEGSGIHEVDQDV